MAVIFGVIILVVAVIIGCCLYRRHARQDLGIGSRLYESNTFIDISGLHQ